MITPLTSSFSSLKRLIVASSLMLSGQLSHAGLFSPSCNPYLSTIMVSNLQESKHPITEQPYVEFKRLHIALYPERDELLGGKNKAHTEILLALAEKNAPAVYLINGMGAKADTGYARYLLDYLHGLGFTVVSIPSTFYDKAAYGFSRHLRPGLTSDDAADVVRLMNVVRAKMKKLYAIEPSKNHLMGVSLGGLQSAYIMANPKLRKGFEKFILINPPLDINYGLRALDSFADGNGSIDHSSFVQQRAPSSEVEAKREGYIERQLQMLVGGFLREAVQDIVYASQLVHDDGVLESRSPDERHEETRQWPIRDYFHRIALPFHERRLAEHGQTVDLEAETLIWPHLKKAPNPANVLVLHSLDDFVSNPVEIAKLKNLPVHSVVSECGGHVGALSYPVFQTPLRNFLTGH